MKYALAVIVMLATGFSGPSTPLRASQEMMPGTARPLIKDLPSTTSGFICPMHPNEVKAAPGTCRGDRCPSKRENHETGSDSAESADSDYKRGDPNL